MLAAGGPSRWSMCWRSFVTSGCRKVKLRGGLLGFVLIPQASEAEELVNWIMLSCVTLLILFSVDSKSEQLQVVGPEASLVAVTGEDMILPCFIKPTTSAVDMTVEWFKLYVKDSLVHLYRDHEDRNENQAQSYRGRTSMFKEELQKGNASLKLSDLRVSDEGFYKCLVEDKSWSDDITVNVTVEAQGSHPVIRMESFDNSGGINLVCESRGWIPEPEILWLDREGVTLTAEDTQIHRDTEGFSVKRRITVYDSSDSNRFYCRLLQKHHMMEAEVIINSKFFDAWKWIVSISVTACLVAVGLMITAFICHKEEIQKEKQFTDFVKKKLYAVEQISFSFLGDGSQQALQCHGQRSYFLFRNSVKPCFYQL
ncbi:hypothetical protein Q7C36_004387 [Tachysurus vachellii]|uniref:Ig-like domain-containing protein n=1 Tax=Tachysurus vachellii TaxID=175792 RepID=A0AA88T2M3_TACVA|nr:hypothetical protein Q7C36_004387 [Tachysurus vachellii]